jgi:glycerol-3-phosphate dehydrogenase (NAD(P)+)
MKVTVLGAGSFGTALAKVLAENNHKVSIWSHSNDHVASINNNQENSVYLPGIILPKSISAMTDKEEALKDSELVVSALPTQVSASVWQDIIPLLPDNASVVVASKGIEKKTHRLVSDIFFDLLPGEANKRRITFLSGPSFAKEVALQIPTVIVIAGYEKAEIKKMQAAFHTDYFRVYGSSDVIGVEIAGALKNVIAIGTGISDGLEYGLNSRSALITRGLHEIARLGTSMGADPLTFMGLAGMGDLVLTCTGDLSRNRQVGLRIGKGESMQEIQNSMRMVAEGVPTTESAYELAYQKQVEMPITSALYEVLYKKKVPREAYRDLMDRSLKFEKDNE